MAITGSEHGRDAGMAPAAPEGDPPDDRGSLRCTPGCATRVAEYLGRLCHQPTGSM
jgi:hypothetical protein